MSSLIEIRRERLEKVKRLRDLGIDPYPSKSNKEYSSNEVVEKYDDLEGKEVTVAGRLMSWREHGELTFGDLQDQSGRIQLYISGAKLPDVSGAEQGIGHDDLGLIDVGDFLEARGVVTKTKSDEISVQPSSIKMLTKSIRPLPDKREGLQDTEAIYRQRYLDITMDREHRDLFLRKAKFWSASRKFMEREGFTEFETPIMENVTGGADAAPFVTHHNALDQDFYLRISSELYQKRLSGAGYEKVYVLGANFRNEGMSDEHLQEFTQLEWYWSYADYRDNMDLCKRLFRHIATEVYGSTEFRKGEHNFDLADEWKEISYPDILKERFGLDIFESHDDDIIMVAKANGVDVSGGANRNRLIDGLWKVIRRGIAGPAFLINEPKFMSPLAKCRGDDPRLTERFHIILAGSENGNGYTELNDPVDQYQRFLGQQSARDAGDNESQMMDIDFVEMLEYGMPPVSGYGHSERLFSFFEDASIRDTTLFPQMRHRVTDAQRELYPEALGTSSESAKPQNFTKRISIAVRDDLEPWQVTNTIAHISAYMGNRLGEDFGTADYFETKDGEKIPRNTQYPILVFKSNAKSLHKLIRGAREQEIRHMGFVRPMIDTTNDLEIAEVTKSMTDDETDYLGVGFFGDNEVLKRLTKKLTLWK